MIISDLNHNSWNHKQLEILIHWWVYEKYGIDIQWDTKKVEVHDVTWVNLRNVILNWIILFKLLYADMF